VGDVWVFEPQGVALEEPTWWWKHGCQLLSQRLRRYGTLTEKQRDGVYGTARQMAACLTNSGISRWVNPVGGNMAGDRRPLFDPDAFVQGTGTLYSLSKEGHGSAGPPVTALTAATIEAAEELATTQPGGRLATPLLGVLDEAANVCRWRNLPDLVLAFRIARHPDHEPVPVLVTGRRRRVQGAIRSWSRSFGESAPKELIAMR
jgi:hypothetical protein